MYTAAHFRMPAEQARELLSAVAAADLVTAHDSGLVATYLPFVHAPEVGEHGALLTHVARNNSQARDPVRGEALVIVHGADHYVSPLWQASWTATGRVVPTWDYLTVHAYGELVVHDDPHWTRDVVHRLTEAHEQDYSLEDVDSDYVQRMLGAVVGLEVRLTRVEAKAKMSQNRPPQDLHGIIDGLAALPGDNARRTAEWLRQHSVPVAEQRAALLEDLAARRGTRSTPG